MGTEDLDDGERFVGEEGKMEGLQELTSMPATRHPGISINPSTPSAVERFGV
jgi:hypothetical protein